MTTHQTTITPDALAALSTIQPVVQIIHSRDPDWECGIQVYVNGVRQHKVEVEDIDPGRGYSPEDYIERRRSADEAADAPTATEFDVDLAEALTEARFEKFGYEG